MTFFHPSHPHIYRDQAEVDWHLARNREAARRLDERRSRAPHANEPPPEERGIALADQQRETQRRP